MKRVIIRQYYSAIQGATEREFLVGFGIDAQLLNELSNAVLPYLQNSQPISITVPENQVEEALNLLESNADQTTREE